MEVFTALYNRSLEEIKPPSSLILQAESFATELKTNKIAFFGNGAGKFATLFSHQNAVFESRVSGNIELARIAWKRYQNSIFNDLAYSEPLYIKEFYTPAKA
jgi:tRNA threonylcarbamoyladenosine biosynthesis protein TsaB